MKQLTLPSWQLEKTCKGYIESRSTRGQITTNANKLAVILLASTAIIKAWDEPKQNISNVMNSWADELHPESKETVDYLFSDNQRYRNIARTVFASVKPAGCYETEQLLAGIENGQIDISLRADS